MHGEERAWSLLGCTCKLITRGFGRSNNLVTDDSLVERRRVTQKFKRRCYCACRACSLLKPGQLHHWMVLKWVDYHHFQTTCDSSQRDSLICKNFIYAWHALITKGVCALNSPQRRPQCLSRLKAENIQTFGKTLQTFKRRATLSCITTQTWKNLRSWFAREYFAFSKMGELKLSIIHPSIIGYPALRVLRVLESISGSLKKFSERKHREIKNQTKTLFLSRWASKAATVQNSAVNSKANRKKTPKKPQKLNKFDHTPIVAFYASYT